MKIESGQPIFKFGYDRADEKLIHAANLETTFLLRQSIFDFQNRVESLKLVIKIQFCVSKME